MKEQSRNFIVGLTTLAGCIGLAFLLVLFGYLPGWVRGGYQIQVVLKDASGLNDGSRVRLNGIAIGVVKSVQLQVNDRGIGVVALATIDHQFDIPRGAVATVDRSILGGSPTLAFYATGIDPQAPDYQQRMQPLPKDGSATIVASEQSMMDQFTSQIQATLAGPAKSLQSAADDFKNLSAEWTEVGKNVRLLTEPRDIQAVNRGEIQGNLTTTLARADQRLKELQVSVDAFNQIIGDRELIENMRKTAANAAQFTDHLNTTAEKVDGFIDQTQADLGTLTKQYVKVASDMSGAIGSMRQAIDQARQGDGTVGKLINDPALYNNLNDAAQRLNAALTEFKLLMQKFQKEGLPVKF
ncbi:MAG: MlaD family protein [Phycisphaeraceae bacterium]